MLREEWMGRKVRKARRIGGSGNCGQDVIYEKKINLKKEKNAITSLFFSCLSFLN